MNKPKCTEYDHLNFLVAAQRVFSTLEAIQVHGAYGFSDEYDVERYLRNAKGAVIYEGTSEIHQLMQAEYALGFRKDRPLRCELPAYNAEYWQAVGDVAPA